MFKRATDGVTVSVSLRMTDGALLMGFLNCGGAGKLEYLLSSDIKFVEFVSKEGQQRFIAHHQIASIEPMASLEEPALTPFVENSEPFEILGLQHSATMDEAKLAFQTLFATYDAERWSGLGVPFEFSRFAIQKTRQLNAAFTAVKSIIQARDDQFQAEQIKAAAMAAAAAALRPMFGGGRAA